MNRFFSKAARRGAACVRTVCGGAIVLTLLLLPVATGCQAPTGTSAIDALRGDLKNLADSMATKRDLATTEDTLAKAHNDLGGRVSQLDTRVGQLATRVDQDLQARMDRLDTGLRETNQRVAAGENSTAIGNHVVDWRLRKLEEPGHRPTFQGVGYGDAPSLPAAPPSAQPPDMTSRTWGVIEIQNNMADWEYMEVNGTATGIAPHTTSHIIVPTGRATTRLIGFEGTKTWWVGAPDFVQRVVINPKPAFDSVVRYP